MSEWDWELSSDPGEETVKKVMDRVMRSLGKKSTPTSKLRPMGGGGGKGEAKVAANMPIHEKSATHSIAY
jgi:hypothetical protein